MLSQLPFNLLACKVISLCTIHVPSTERVRHHLRPLLMKAGRDLVGARARPEPGAELVERRRLFSFPGLARACPRVGGSCGAAAVGPRLWACVRWFHGIMVSTGGTGGEG